MNIYNFNYQRLLFNNNTSIVKNERKTFNGTINNEEEVALQIREQSEMNKIEKSNTSQKITKMESGQKQIYDYFSFINQIDDYDRWEQSRIMSIIQDVTSKPQGTLTGYDSSMLLLAQTKFELEELSDKIIPEKYRAQMEEAIQSYISDSLEKEIQSLNSMYQNIVKNSVNLPKPTQSWMKNVSLKNLQQLQDGTHRIFVAEELYMELFEKLKNADTHNFINEYENILNTYEVEQKTLQGIYWNENDELLTKQFQENMRAKWNNLVNHLSGFEEKRLSTYENPVINVWI